MLKALVVMAISLAVGDGLSDPSPINPEKVEVIGGKLLLSGEFGSAGCEVVAEKKMAGGITIVHLKARFPINGAAAVVTPWSVLIDGPAEIRCRTMVIRWRLK